MFAVSRVGALARQQVGVARSGARAMETLQGIPCRDKMPKAQQYILSAMMFSGIFAFPLYVITNVKHWSAALRE